MEPPAGGEEGRLIRGLRPLGAVIVGLALATGAGLFGPTPAAAWSPGACPTSAGVTVVVDFGAFGAGTATRCVPGAPASGLAALASAGFSVTPVTTQPGFVCRIDQRPPPNAESCATTPPGTAYWSYWTAPRGGAWRYSPVGASASRPTPGAVEGWSFVSGGAAQPPSVEPPAVPAATPAPTAPPTPRPTARPTPPPAPGSTARATARPSERSSGMSSATPVLPSAEASVATPTVAATASATVTPLASGSATMVAETPVASPIPAPGSGASEAGSGPLGTVAGIGLVAVVGAAALAFRRRGAMGRV